ncbi:MAG TPA: hypothetical protein VFQ47_08625 [Nitrososphaera sp.]|jgi:hypothetical protein|nr:hypothetical protein [Nitrososphaera sp.]
MKTASLLLIISVSLGCLCISCSRSGQVTIHHPDGSTTTGQALSNSSVDPKTEKNHLAAKYYTGKDWQVTKITVRPSSLSYAQKEVLVQVQDGNDLRDLVFSDKHVEFGKFSQLRAGNEVRFDFSTIDGDPELKGAGDREKAKFLRLSLVR